MLLFESPGHFLCVWLRLGILVFLPIFFFGGGGGGGLGGADGTVTFENKGRYSSVPNRRVGQNKHAGGKNLTKH